MGTNMETRVSEWYDQKGVDMHHMPCIKAHSAILDQWNINDIRTLQLFPSEVLVRLEIHGESLKDNFI